MSRISNGMMRHLEELTLENERLKEENKNLSAENRRLRAENERLRKRVDELEKGMGEKIAKAVEESVTKATVALLELIDSKDGEILRLKGKSANIRQMHRNHPEATGTRKSQTTAQKVTRSRAGSTGIVEPSL